MNEDNRGYVKGLITGAIGLALVFAALSLGINIYKGVNNKDSKNSSKISEIFGDKVEDKVSLINAYIEKYYMEDVEDSVICDGIYSGMMEALKDPYSEYYTKEQYAKLMESTTGEYCGIGVSVLQDADTGIIKVIKVFKNSPAMEAGIKNGDTIFAVGDEEIAGKDLNDVILEIKGDEDTSIKLTVIRDNKKEDCTVIRKNIEIDTVDYKMLSDGVGWLYISQFDGVTTNQVKNAIEDLQNQGMTRIIVDLRDNPGGRLDVVTDVLDYFLPKDKLLLCTETKEGTKTEYKSKTDGIVTDMPMTVLINENSASASEVFTGAIKCYDRGKVVGTKSFGKGIVQSIYPFVDGSAVKITTGKYYLPDGSNIHKVGIEPDIKVELPEGAENYWELEESQDVQLQKALEAVKQ